MSASLERIINNSIAQLETHSITKEDFDEITSIALEKAEWEVELGMLTPLDYMKYELAIYETKIRFGKEKRHYN